MTGDAAICCVLAEATPGATRDTGVFCGTRGAVRECCVPGVCALDAAEIVDAGMFGDED